VDRIHSDRGRPRPVDDALVESARSAVPALLPVRFCGPLAEPGVRLSTHRALHDRCRQDVVGRVNGLGILVPR
jgi:hypothetical protein